MEHCHIEESDERLRTLERRIDVIEGKFEAFLRLNSDDHRKSEYEDDLINKYGECVDKSVAAKILGVTRATVYTMLSDGRIEGACSGNKVSVRSIARHISSPKRNRKVK